MKDYSAMSDFDIQQAVLHKTWGKHPVRLLGKMMLDIMLSDYDPCNNPTDAWPIILENRINLVAPISYDSTQDWMAYPAHDSDLSPTDEKPLRAAMIAFLMLKDAEKGHG